MGIFVLCMLASAGVGLLLVEHGRRTAMRRIAHTSLHDPLTDLPNRHLLQSRLDTAVARARRNGFTMAVLFLNLDRFQVVNHNMGHSAGDAVLRKVADRLREFVRDEDTLARVGGDEFAILLEQIDGNMGAVRVAERILKGMATAVEAGGAKVSISTAIGIAIAERGGKSSSDLLGDANVAMRRAKELGRARYTIFDRVVGEAVRRRLSVEADLSRAVELGEFEMRYQPQIDMATGRIISVEGLVRWRHPERGLVLPGEFIPIAEQTGLIDPLGRWVLTEACRVGARLARPTFDRPPVAVGVNVSARQLARGDQLAAAVGRVLDAAGLDPRMLILEITETLLVGDNDPAAAAVHALRELGVQIAIDDFGTGYSSLGYLRYLPVSMVKLDRSFISGLDQGANDTLVRWMIDLTSSLGLSLCAEGVETDTQLERLRDMGCPQGQGIGICEPVHEEELDAAIRRLWDSTQRSPVGGR